MRRVTRRHRMRRVGWSDRGFFVIISVPLIVFGLIFTPWTGLLPSSACPTVPGVVYSGGQQTGCTVSDNMLPSFPVSIGGFQVDLSVGSVLLALGVALLLVGVFSA